MKSADVTRFTASWAQSQPSLSAFISATITDFSDAEDVLQRVAAAAVQKFDEYDPSRPFLPWAIGIARLEILRHLRDRSTDRHQFIASSLDEFAWAFESLASEHDARREALAACLAKVGGRARRILQQRYGQALKTSVIAQQMGLSPGNVSVILHRTYSQLRECIERRLLAEGIS